MRLLNIDIETRPATAYIWDCKTSYVPPGNIIEPKSTICYAAKWIGEPKVYFHSVWHDGREKMLRKIHGLLEEADAVVHFNGDRFDRPMINTEFLLNGYAPPAPTANIDLLKVLKRNFAFMSNKLDFVSRQLDTSKKLEHEGFSLWLKVMRGDKDAQVKMRKYNIQDVHANESLYNTLLPWITPHPSLAVEMAAEGHEDVFACPRCGSPELTKQGLAYTKVRAYQRYKCNDCGGWTRSSKSVASTSISDIAA